MIAFSWKAGDPVASLATVDFSKGGGVITVVAQDATTGSVLMIAHADGEALERTMATGEMHYRSRTRGLWRKGETSGNVQQVVSLSGDCDGDAILARVIPAGPACHTGTRSCFGDSGLIPDAVALLAATIAERAGSAPEASPSRESYTRRLLNDRNLRLKKIGEESAELLVALSDDDRDRAAEEGADLIYHVLVGLAGIGVPFEALQAELMSRARAQSPAPDAKTR